MLKKELKNNKYTIFVFVVFVILFILGWVLFGLFMPKTGTPVYGDRLKGIENVEVKSDQSKKLIEELKKLDYVTDAKVDIKGATINVIITVKEKTEVKTAKGAADIVLKALEDKQKSFYDIQLFVQNEKEKINGYPFIGYKNSKDKGFTF